MENMVLSPHLINTIVEGEVGPAAAPTCPIPFSVALSGIAAGRVGGCR